MREHIPSDPRDEQYELFVSRFAQTEGDLRRFIRSLLPTSTDTDEVLQQTAIIAWRKFNQYDPSTKFIKWACVIARFEALAYRRKMARDRLVFREDILELMADEGTEALEEARPDREALDACLKAMPERQKRFLILAHTPGVKVKDMATEAGSSPAAFYMRINRLRRSLMKCIEQRISPGGLAR